MKIRKKSKNNHIVKVMAFGTFDLIHPGHIAYLEEAIKFGSRLYVVVAHDKTVQKIKRRKPHLNAAARKRVVGSLKPVFRAFIGDSKNPYRIISKLQPDVIALGYDQKNFVRGLYNYLARKKIKIKIVRCRAYSPYQFKSSKLTKCIC